MRRHRAFAIAAAFVVTAPSPAGADPADPGVALNIKTPSTLKTDGGTELRLPPGIFLNLDSWAMLETETKRLQDAETRLTAENASLRKSASGASFGWYVVGAALAVGLVTGFLVGR